jgi:diguanylate cyclase (GGDEF) domain
MQKASFMKMYAYVLAAFFVVMIAFGALVYQSTVGLMIKQLASKCLGIASSVAVMIETDIDGFRRMTETLDSDSEYYNAMSRRMQTIQENNRDNIAYVYVERQVSDTEIMYLLDGLTQDHVFFSPLGYTAPMSETERKAYLMGEQTHSEWFVTDQYGTLLTTYAPVRDPNTNELLALVGTDVSINQYTAIVRNQLVIILVSVVGSILLLSLSLLISSGKLEHAIYRDGLTGAYNKSYFLRSLRDQLAFAARKGTPLCVLIADIDYFKKVNDTYGHIFGDVVLKEISATISSMLRKMDCLARYGGEEFTLFLPETSLEDACRAAERIRVAVETAQIYNAEFDKAVGVTISIGVVKVKPGRTPTEAVEMADKALYQAKINRNEVAVYDYSK